MSPREESPELWPIFGLTITTRQLSLRPVADADLDELVALAERGIHDPRLTPFPNLWTDRRGHEFRQGFAQYFWAQRASWSPLSWTLAFAVRRGGVLVGVQQVGADDFAMLRTVHTSSWLGRAHQGSGTGTAMRGAVLALAFEALGAEIALSSSLAYNPGSIRVSEKLGYVRNGLRRENVRGVPVDTLHFRLDREVWIRQRPVRARIAHLEPCLGLLGLTPRQAPRGGSANRPRPAVALAGVTESRVAPRPPVSETAPELHPRTQRDVATEPSAGRGCA